MSVCVLTRAWHKSQPLRVDTCNPARIRTFARGQFPQTFFLTLLSRQLHSQILLDVRPRHSTRTIRPRNVHSWTLPMSQMSSQPVDCFLKYWYSKTSSLKVTSKFVQNANDLNINILNTNMYSENDEENKARIVGPTLGPAKILGLPRPLPMSLYKHHCCSGAIVVQCCGAEPSLQAR